MMLTLHTQERKMDVQVNFHGREEGVVSDFELSPFEVVMESKGEFCLLQWWSREELEGLQFRISEALRKQDAEMIERTL